MQLLGIRQFDALTDHFLTNRILDHVVESDRWTSDELEVLGVAFHNRASHEYSWVTVSRDEQLRYTVLEFGVWRPERAVAWEEMIDAIRLAAPSEGRGCRLPGEVAPRH